METYLGHLLDNDPPSRTVPWPRAQLMEWRRTILGLQAVVLLLEEKLQWTK